MIYAIIIVLLHNGKRINALQVILLPSITIQLIFLSSFAF